MAVEAQHIYMNTFQQINTNREFVNTNQVSNYGYNDNNSGTKAENLLPLAESGVTYNLPSVPRKRSRDSMNEFNRVIVPQKQSPFHDFSSLEQSFPVQIQNQQSDMDQIIAQHTKKIRMEVEERQKQQTRIMVSAIGEGVMKKLRDKDEYIHKVLRLNHVLQDKVKSLYVENQLWKDLAQTNEATVMSLRCNLEQVLTQVSDDRLFPVAGNMDVAEEAESCGSSGHNDDNNDEVVARRRVVADAAEDGGVRNRMCRKCGERESCVLLLPCRHLCLCTVCGTTLQSTCPVCNSSMNATVHVNVSD